VEVYDHNQEKRIIMKYLKKLKNGCRLVVSATLIRVAKQKITTYNQTHDKKTTF